MTEDKGDEITVIEQKTSVDRVNMELNTRLELLVCLANTTVNERHFRRDFQHFDSIIAIPSDAVWRVKQGRSDSLIF